MRNIAGIIDGMKSHKFSIGRASIGGGRGRGRGGRGGGKEKEKKKSYLIRDTDIYPRWMELIGGKLRHIQVGTHSHRVDRLKRVHVERKEGE